MWIRAKHDGMELAMVNTDNIISYVIVKDPDYPKQAQLAAMVEGTDVLLHYGSVMACHEKLNKILELTKLDIIDV